jgi:hypothetical protein
MAILYSDNFQSDTLGQLPSGWTNTNDTWVVTDVNPVSGTQALLASANDGAAVLCSAPGTSTNIDVRYDVNVQDGFVSPILRSNAGYTTGYLFAVNSGTNYNSINVYKITGSESFSQIASNQPGYSGSVSAGTKLSVRARIINSTLYFKMWLYGASEPSAWSFTVTDSTYSAAGYGGIRNQFGSSTGGSTVGNFILGDGALAAGTSTVTGVGATTANLANTGATGGTLTYSYQWYRSTTSGFTPGSGNMVAGATSLTLNDTGLTSETTYYYVLGVTDAASGTAYSTQVSATPGVLANGTLSSSAVGATVATITDSGASGGSGGYAYQYYRSTTSGFTPGGGNIVSGATSRTLNDTGLSPSTTYYYKNVVTDSSSGTATSPQLTVTTGAALANGTLSSGSIGSSTATVIDSGASGGSTPYSYQWYRSTTSGFTPGSGNLVSGATSVTLNDTGLA